MAERKRKPQRTSISADRAEMLRKSRVQAGKPKAAGSSKAATITRQMQNKGVKDGTIRLGRSGKSYNVYDAKTGTWKRGVVKAASPAQSARKNEHMNRPKGGQKTGGSGQVRVEASRQFPALKTAKKGEVRYQGGRKFTFDGKVWKLNK